MSKIGGYAMIDFKETTLTSSGVKVDGVYKSIAKAVALGKPLMICNAIADGLGAIPSQFTNVLINPFNQSGTEYWVGGFVEIREAGADSLVTFTYLTITSDDTVTLKTAVYPQA